MDGATGKPFAVMFLVLWALLAAGCAEMDLVPSWMPFQDQPDEDLAGIPSPHEKIERLRKLGGSAGWANQQQKQQTSVELARSLAAEEDPTIRLEIVRALGEYPGAESDSVLEAALSDPDADVRAAACEAWGKRGDARAARLLSGILGGDIDKDVRLAAARALGRSKDPTAVAALGTALEDKDPAMQYRAVLSLRRLTGQDFGNDVNRWRQYVNSGPPQPAEPISMAERIRAWF